MVSRPILLYSVLPAHIPFSARRARVEDCFCMPATLPEREERGRREVAARQGMPYRFSPVPQRVGKTNRSVCGQPADFFLLHNWLKQPRVFKGECPLLLCTSPVHQSRACDSARPSASPVFFSNETKSMQVLSWGHFRRAGGRRQEGRRARGQAGWLHRLIRQEAIYIHAPTWYSKTIHSDVGIGPTWYNGTAAMIRWM